MKSKDRAIPILLAVVFALSMGAIDVRAAGYSGGDSSGVVPGIRPEEQVVKLLNDADADLQSAKRFVFVPSGPRITYARLISVATSKESLLAAAMSKYAKALQGLTDSETAGSESGGLRARSLGGLLESYREFRRTTRGTRQILGASYNAKDPNGEILREATAFLHYSFLRLNPICSGVPWEDLRSSMKVSPGPGDEFGTRSDDFDSKGKGPTFFLGLAFRMLDLPPTESGDLEEDAKTLVGLFCENSAIRSFESRMPQKGTGISKAFQVLRQNLEGGKPDLYVIASKDIGMGILDLHVEKGQKKMNILWQGENQANPVYQPAEETPFGRSHHIAVGQLLSREVVNRWLTMESEGNNRAAVY